MVPVADLKLLLIVLQTLFLISTINIFVTNDVIFTEIITDLYFCYYQILFLICIGQTMFCSHWDEERTTTSYINDALFYLNDTSTMSYNPMLFTVVVRLERQLLPWLHTDDL